MPEDYAYMVSNNKIAPILEAIERAAKPDRLTHEVLKHWGFTSSNDRAVIPLFRRLGILDQNSAPTRAYDDIKDRSTRGTTLASLIRETYSDLFAIDTNIHRASDDAVRSAFSRVTGKDAQSVARYLSTFKALVALADFDKSPLAAETLAKARVPSDLADEVDDGDGSERAERTRSTARSFHYNIQIHLPATTDISVYNAIFKALKEHLDV